MKWNILIVEDEGLLARRLQTMLKALDSGVVIAAVTSSVAATVQWLQLHPQPDLIFMDIELSDGRSFDVFQSVQVEAPIIFTTAYDEFALRAFKLNSIDYLLKPIKEDELKTGWTKFLARQKNSPASFANQLQQMLAQLNSGSGQPQFRDRFLVKLGQKMMSVDSHEIAYITIRNAVSILVTKQKQKFALDYSLDQLEEMLDPKHFFRANRQFIVSHDAIAVLHPDLNSKIRIELKLPDHENILVSRERASTFKDWMGE